MPQKTSLTLLATSLALTFLLLTIIAVTARAEAPAKGKRVFLANGCNTCHGVAAEGIEAKMASSRLKGPDLGGRRQLGGENLAAFVRGEVEIGGRKHARPFKGSDEELQAIIDWLGSLEAQE